MKNAGHRLPGPTSQGPVLRRRATPPLQSAPVERCQDCRVIVEFETDLWVPPEKYYRRFPGGNSRSSRRSSTGLLWRKQSTSTGQCASAAKACRSQGGRGYRAIFCLNLWIYCYYLKVCLRYIGFNAIYTSCRARRAALTQSVNIFSVLAGDISSGHF